jgi:hypothetical protein
MKITPYGRLSNVLIASLAAGLLSGCSANFVPSPVEPEQVPIGNIQGSVHGGQAPVSGAHLYMLAAATSGYGNHVTSLINSTAPNAFEDGSGNYYVVTDANGNFAVGGDYTCTVGQQVYMVASGGNPGLSGIVNNGAILQMAGLGQCPAAGNMAALVPYLVINEVTTVAFAYAMGGFGSSAYFIGSNAPTATSPGAIAIANAMANSKNIVNLWPGTAPAVANGNANSIVPQTKINALANILAACVNTSSAASAQCTALFNAARSSAGVPATDEANAIFNIVHMPANTSTFPTHVNDIWSLTASNQVFTPTLGSAPTDWTMPVIYNSLVSIPGTTGNQITSGPFNMAFDANGNAWIGDRVKGVVEVGPQGASNTYNPGFGMVKGVAVSPADGNIWVSDYVNSIVYILNSSGTIVAIVTQKIDNGKNLHGPILTGFSLDPSSGYMAYQANEDIPGIVMFEAGLNGGATNPIYSKVDYIKGSNSGAFPDVDTPGWIAVDQTGMAWVPSTDSGEVGNAVIKWKNGAEISNPSEASGPESYSTVSDSNSNIWLTTNTSPWTLEEIRSGGTSVGFTQTGGGMNAPYKLAVDGGNTIWIANDGANTLSAWSQTSGSWLATSGFSTSAASGTGCVVLGVDGSGNVWTGNADGSVTQLLGLATPTSTPFYGGMTVTTTSGSNQTTVITPGNLGSKP